MRKPPAIPLHPLPDQLGGVYVASLTAPKRQAGPAYESARPHQHDYYYCVLLEAGSLELEVDFERVLLQGPALFLSYPGQIYRVVAARPERGWYLAFAPAVLDEPLRDLLEQCLAEIIQLPLVAGPAAAFAAAAGQLAAVYHAAPAPLYRQAIVQALVQAFGYQLISAYIPVERHTLGRHSVRGVALTKAFRQALRQEYRAFKKPAAYARQLHVTPTYLNDAVRAVTGFPVTYHIQQHTMREAQRLLRYADLTVRETAYALGFDDAQYFNRLFRKVVGVAPGAFQKTRPAAVVAA